MAPDLRFARLLAVMWLTVASFSAPAQEPCFSWTTDGPDSLDSILESSGGLAGLALGIERLGGDPQMLIPVVYPELLRYSALRDWAEVGGLQLLYVRFGAAYSDFSVGPFQMKPSFVEKLEEWVEKLQLSQFVGITEYPGVMEERDRRAERVRRLGDLDWQITYLLCFAAVAERRCEGLTWAGMDAGRRVRFLASAYNYGFWRSEAEIRRWEKSERFTLSPLGGGPRQSFCDLAERLYHTYSGWIATEK